MNKEEIQLLINDLEATIERENATFGIYKYGSTSDESYIKANKEGLKLFALELLKKAKYIEEYPQKTVAIDYLQNWFDIKADTFTQYIEIVDKPTAAFKNVPYKLSIKDKLIPVAFIITGFIGLLLIIIGVYTVIKHFF